jgi:hypothetical protein
MELALLMAQYLADEREVQLVAESGVPTGAWSTTAVAVVASSRVGGGLGPPVDSHPPNARSPSLLPSPHPPCRAAAFIGSDGQRFGSPSLATAQYQQAIVAATNAPGSGAGVEGAAAALLNRLNSAAAAGGRGGSPALSPVDASAGGVPPVASGGALDSLGSSDGESRDRSSSLEGGGGAGKLRRPRFAAGRGERPSDQS